MLQGEQVVAGGDTRAAVTDDGSRSDSPECVAPVFAQIFWRAKRAVLVEVGLKEMIGGTRNVAGRFVDRLGLAPEALGRARVDESPVRVAHNRCDLLCVDGH